jgi:hypothetical protein
MNGALCGPFCKTLIARALLLQNRTGDKSQHRDPGHETQTDSKRE